MVPFFSTDEVSYFKTFSSRLFHGPLVLSLFTNRTTSVISKVKRLVSLPHKLPTDPQVVHSFPYGQPSLSYSYQCLLPTYLKQLFHHSTGYSNVNNHNKTNVHYLHDKFDHPVVFLHTERIDF